MYGGAQRLQVQNNRKWGDIFFIINKISGSSEHKIISYTKKPKCKNQKAWEEEFSGIKPSLLILAGFLVDNFERMEVTGERFVAIFDQESACG